jgi:predicted ATPase
VPLFVEELTKAVVEAGADRGNVPISAVPPSSLGVPATLHASLLGRLDRLGPAAKNVAQVGAAIGRDFSYELLAAAVQLTEPELQKALRRLVEAGLVFQRGAPPAAEYLFKHALVQDTAYSTLLRVKRRELHARVAAALEQDFADLAERQPELLAQHAAEAGLIEKSVAYWGKAARRSAARSAMAEAAAQFQRGLDQLGLLPNTRVRQRQELELCSGMGAALMASKGFAAPETGQAYARARELWEQLGSPPEFLQVSYGQSRYHMFRGELELSKRLNEDLLRLSRQRSDSAGLVLGHYSSGCNLMFAGRFAASRSHLEEAIAAYASSSERSLVHQAAVYPQVTSQAFLGNVLFCLGYPDQALARICAAITEARALAHPATLATALGFAARVISFSGGSAALGEWVDEMIAITAGRALAQWNAGTTIFSGWLKVQDGEVAEGISLLRRGLTAFRAPGTVMFVPHLIALLASAYEIAGQAEKALSLLHDALRLVERTRERWFAAELHRLKGQLLLRQGHAETADESYRRALGIAREQEAKLWELRAATSLARLWGELGQRGEARELLAPVYGWFTEGFATADLKEAKVLLDELA